MPDTKSLALLFSVRLLSAMGVTMILPVLPDIAHNFNLSVAEAGLVLVSFTLAEASMTPVAGILSDRYGRKAVLLPALILFAVGGILCAFAQTWHEVLLYRIIQGIGAGPLGVLYTILAADMYDESHLPEIMGKLTAVSSVGTFIYPIVGGWVGEWSWRMPFWAWTLALPVAVLTLFVPLRHPSRKMDWGGYFRETRKIILQKKSIGFFVLVFLCYCIIYGPLNTYFPLMAQDRFHVTSSRIGMVFSFVALGSYLASAGLPYLHIHWNWSFGWLIFIGALCYLFSQIFIPLMPHLWICVLPLLISGIAQGLSIPIINDSVALLAPSQDRAAILATSETFVRLSQSVSPLLFSLGWTFGGWKGPYIMGIITSLFICFLVLRLFGLKHSGNISTSS